VIGRPRVHHRTTDSTNLRARELAMAGAPHGTVVTAGEQTAGRGRQGRTWVGPPGRALLASVVVRDPPALLPLLAAVAVAEACGDAARIKWPNDVLLDDRKVAGILAEGRPHEGWAVLGVGLNVAVRAGDLPEELRDRATGLGLEPGDLDAVLDRLLDRLDARLGDDAETILAAWSARDGLRGREIAWAGGRGVAEGIDGAGRLLVRAPGGEVSALDAGEVHLGPPP
jgi:BirA family transcriptional regulator, biotin operon repressor / biotin---[acetyl-CoA-carboxylase] ligase